MYERVCASLNAVDLRKNKFRLLTSLVNNDIGTPTITKSLVQKAQEADPEKWGSIVNISNCLGNSKIALVILNCLSNSKLLW